MRLIDVEAELDALIFDDILAQRTISIDMYQIGSEIVITAWQCNMARLKTTDLKLPTVLRFVLDDTGNVTDAELMENFKGSQGMPCSQSYLNRILKKVTVGMSFNDDDTILHNENMLHCRHIFELTAAAMTFYRYCRSKLGHRNRIYEVTKAYPLEKGLRVHDEYIINGEKNVTEEELVFSAGDLTMLANGKLGSINRLLFEAVSYSDDNIVFKTSDSIENVSGSSNAVMSMMKLFAKPWKDIGRSIGIRRNFYFTNLVPSSLYGVLIQAIALTIFPNNYNYFQHSLAGLQRNQNIPLCIGMALDIDEIRKYYPEFREDDMFG